MIGLGWEVHKRLLNCLTSFLARLLPAPTPSVTRRSRKTPPFSSHADCTCLYRCSYNDTRKIWHDAEKDAKYRPGILIVGRPVEAAIEPNFTETGLPEALL